MQIFSTKLFLKLVTDCKDVDKKGPHFIFDNIWKKLTKQPVFTELLSHPKMPEQEKQFFSELENFPMNESETSVRIFILPWKSSWPSK